jgi:ABC-type proline/glycine betaine transport system substrate-binding protein
MATHEGDRGEDGTEGEGWSGLKPSSRSGATSLLAAACNDVQEGDGDAGGDTGGTTSNVAQCGSEPINLAVNAWVGAEANAAVAAALMQQEMGCEVELVKIDEFPQFAAMQQGEIDASLEVWPSVHPKDYKQYIEDPNGGVVDGGELGILGNIGWFIPSTCSTSTRVRIVRGHHRQRVGLRDGRDR